MKTPCKVCLEPFERPKGTRINTCGPVCKTTNMRTMVRDYKRRQPKKTRWCKDCTAKFNRYKGAVRCPACRKPQGRKTERRSRS